MGAEERIRGLQDRMGHYEIALLDLINLQQNARTQGEESLAHRVGQWIPELMADINKMKKVLADQRERVG